MAATSRARLSVPALGEPDEPPPATSMISIRLPWPTGSASEPPPSPHQQSTGDESQRPDAETTPEPRARQPSVRRRRLGAFTAPARCREGRRPRAVFVGAQPRTGDLADEGDVRRPARVVGEGRDETTVGVRSVLEEVEQVASAVHTAGAARTDLSLVHHARCAVLAERPATVGRERGVHLPSVGVADLL